MILKISLGHEKLKTRKRTKMKSPVGYCSIPKKNQNEMLSGILYISVSLNVDFRTLRPSDAIFSWTQDAGAADARRGCCGRKTRALWTQDAASAMDARRGRCGRKTRRALWTQDAGAVDARRGQTQC